MEAEPARAFVSAGMIRVWTSEVYLSHMSSRTKMS